MPGAIAGDMIGSVYLGVAHVIGDHSVVPFQLQWETLFNESYHIDAVEQILAR